jgi:serine/threonine protein kinase
MVAIKQFRDSDQFVSGNCQILCFIRSLLIQTMRIAEREITILKLLQGHPNIIKILSTFKHNQKMFMVFELMQQTLLDLLQSQADGKLEREQVRLIVF